jgi:hypothetical protein
MDNIAVLGLWYPTIYGNDTAGRILKYFDPTQISVVLVLDVCLNIYFVVSIKRKLLSFGLGKYKMLIKANIVIILANMSTDVRFLLIYLSLYPFKPIIFPLLYAKKLTSTLQIILCVSYFTFTNLWL